MARTAVVAGTATAVSNRVSRRQATRWAEDGTYPPQQPAWSEPPQQPQPADDDLGAQIERLAQLHAQGVLSDSEFAAAKSRLLGI